MTSSSSKTDDTTEGPAQKRPRFDNNSPDTNSLVALHDIPGRHAEAQDPGILRLPLEILAEILLQTGYPGDLLAVARTCKVMCQQLASPGSDYIWRKMRIKMEMPDPGAFSDTTSGSEQSGVQCFIGREIAYAAFVFDGGNCEICGKYMGRMLTSFALRLRLCGNQNCRVQFREQTVRARSAIKSSLWHAVPVLETAVLFKFDRHPSWPNIEKVCRSKALETFFQRYHGKSSDEALWDLKNAISRNNIWMKFCVALHLWTLKWERLLETVRIMDRIIGNDFATKHGWSYPEMVATPSYQQLLRQRLLLRETITPQDLEDLRPSLAKELFPLEEKRKRQNQVDALQDNRKDVRKFYHHLKSKNSIFPSFSTFRKFHMVQFLRSPEVAASGTNPESWTENRFLLDMVNHQLNGWIEKAKQDLLSSLGCEEEWRSMVPSSFVLHPSLRLDARWNCKVCGEVEEDYQKDECLDFTGVCKHECKEKDIKKQKRGRAKVWDAGNFVKDERACAVMRECLRGYQLNIETVKRIPRLDWAFWTCDACSPGILIHTENLLGHSHRHDRPIQLTLISDTNSHLNKPGLTKCLSQRDGNAALWREKHNYRCLHCPQAINWKREGRGREEDRQNVSNTLNQSTPQSVDVARAVSHSTQLNKSRSKGIFTFDGLRSHLSARHQIHKIRDEDFICIEPVKPAA